MQLQQNPYFNNMVTNSIQLQIITGTNGEKYTILKELGQGSEGIVYKGEIFSRPEEKVAIKKQKILHKKEIIEKFQKKKFNYIINTIDIIYEQNSVFTIMDYADGELYQLLQGNEYKQKSGTQKNQLFLQIVQGVEELHSLDFIHRDLKPENVVYCEQQNGQILLKLCDFGLTSDQNNLAKTANLGTPYYWAPELISDQLQTEYSTPVDIWALGMIWYEMKTGKTMFNGKNYINSQASTILELRNQIKNVVQEKVDQIIDETTAFNFAEKKLLKMKILNIKPSARYTAKDLKEELMKMIEPQFVISNQQQQFVLGNQIVNQQQIFQPFQAQQLQGQQQFNQYRSKGQQFNQQGQQFQIQGNFKPVVPNQKNNVFPLQNKPPFAIAQKQQQVEENLGIGEQNIQQQKVGEQKNEGNKGENDKLINNDNIKQECTNLSHQSLLSQLEQEKSQRKDLQEEINTKNQQLETIEKERDMILTEKEEFLKKAGSQKDFIQNLEQQLRENTQLLTDIRKNEKDKDKLLNEKEDIIKQKSQNVQHLEQKVSEIEQQLVFQKQENEKNGQNLVQKECTICQLEKNVRDSGQRLLFMEKIEKERDKLLIERDELIKSITQKECTLFQLEQSLKEREQEKDMFLKVKEELQKLISQKELKEYELVYKEKENEQRLVCMDKIEKEKEKLLLDNNSLIIQINQKETLIQQQQQKLRENEESITQKDIQYKNKLVNNDKSLREKYDQDFSVKWQEKLQELFFHQKQNIVVICSIQVNLLEKYRDNLEQKLQKISNQQESFQDYIANLQQYKIDLQQKLDEAQKISIEYQAANFYSQQNIFQTLPGKLQQYQQITLELSKDWNNINSQLKLQKQQGKQMLQCKQSEQLKSFQNKKYQTSSSIQVQCADQIKALLTKILQNDKYQTINEVNNLFKMISEISSLILKSFYKEEYSLDYPQKLLSIVHSVQEQYQIKTQGIEQISLNFPQFMQYDLIKQQSDAITNQPQKVTQPDQIESKAIAMQKQTKSAEKNKTGDIKKISQNSQQTPQQFQPNQQTKKKKTNQ